VNDCFWCAPEKAARDVANNMEIGQLSTPNDVQKLPMALQAKMALHAKTA
jgi:hypothetical protein